MKTACGGVLILLLGVVGVAAPVPAAAQTAGTGQLRVTTSPPLPSQIIVNDIPRNTWGLDWLDLPPGTYTVRFTRVEGWNTPAAQTVTVTSGATTTVTGVFTQRGTLKVDTTPAAAGNISVDGIPRNKWGVLTDIAVGAHQVCFGPAPGVENPPCEPVTVSAGATTAVTGTYRPSSLGVSRVAAGGHTCAILAAGTLRCWGDGGLGQLGYGNTNRIGDNETPGSVGPVNLGPGRTATAVATGTAHTCAILDNGTVKCWGAAAQGQLGYGNTTQIGDNETPRNVGVVNLGAGRTATAIAAGIAHTCAILDDGTVRCWGDGTGGRLGYGTTTTIGDNETPASVGPVDLGEGGAAVAITAGGWHTCVILDNGSVRCWGLGNDGRLGYGTTANVGDDETPGAVGPVNLGAGRTAFAISAAGEGGGSGHTCAVLDDGNVRCWGAAAAGRLGYGNGNNIGDNEAPGSVGPVNLGAGRTAIKVNASGFHTCAILDNGTVKCWGSGSEGRLGYGNTATIGDDETPAAVGVVDLGAGRTATALAGWGNYTCALLNDDTLRCWGRAGNPSDGTLGYPNFVGDVGDNETPGSMGPVNVTTAGPSPKGQLRVTTTPALPTQISINGAVADSWSVDWLDLPPGQYTVSFGDIAGWTTPAPTVVTVNDGGLATVNGAFVQRGSLRVTTSAPVGAVISVDGVPRNEWGMWTDLPTGSHQVCFSPVVTLTTPPCQSVTVNAGALAAVVGRYNAHWYRADGNPNDSVGANNALWQGTAAYGTGDAGGADQAFSLNGTNHLTATVGAVGGGNFAAQIRFKTGQTGLTSLFEARPSCGSPAFWGMRLTAAGRVAAEFGPDDLLGSTALLNDDAWHTAKLQRSGTTLSLIVDGKVDATAVVTGPSVGVETARIGRSACVGADGTASFVGLIDDVRLGQPGDFTGPLPAFANGSFEQPTIASGSFQRVPPLTIPSWTVTGQTVDVVSAGFDIPPHHGVNHLDMNGAEPGTICQSFATTAGVPYQVGFWMSRAPALASGQLTASITGGPSLVAGHSGPVSVTNPNWQFHTFGFNAAGATSTLCLAANVPASGIQGSRVDNVTVGV